MSVLKHLSGWAIVIAAATLVAMSWVSAALAEADGDGDGFDGDELLSLPILIGVVIVGAVAWSVYRRRSAKPHK